MTSRPPRRETRSNWTMWGVCSCQFQVSFQPHSPGANLNLRLPHRQRPARWSRRTPYTAYASSSGPAPTGTGIANRNSRPANEPKMKHKINSHTHLTWSSPSTLHVSAVHPPSSILSPVNRVILIDAFRWKACDSCHFSWLIEWTSLSLRVNDPCHAMVQTVPWFGHLGISNRFKRVKFALFTRVTLIPPSSFRVNKSL